MLGRIFKSIYIFHSFFGVIFIGTIGFGAWYFVNSGLFDSSHTTMLFEASKVVKELNQGKFLKELSQRISSNQIGRANSLFADMESKITYVDKIVSSHDHQDNIEKSMKKLQKSLNEVSLDVSIDELLAVLGKKITSFRVFVADNNWRTLTRMITRIEARVDKMKDFNYPSYSSATRAIIQDVQIMRNVTESSRLDRNTKSIILLRLKGLMTELQMLDNYMSNYQNLNLSMKDFEKYVDLWQKDVSPEVSEQILNLEKNGKNFFLGMAALFLGNILFMVGGFLFYRRVANKQGARLGEKIISTINTNIISSKLRFNNDELCEGFNESITRINGYVRRQMSLGNSLQSMLPFPAIMLDSNLKVVWGNQSFSSEWRIAKDDIDAGLLSWDYISRFTNLGDSNPVGDAFDRGIAGIYQIQLSLGDTKVPYEMYVCPEINEEDPNDDINLKPQKVMLFFYSLTSMEDTITEQAMAIINPIKKTIDAMLEGRFDEEYIEKYKVIFERAGINDIFKGFCKYNKNVEDQSNALMKDIERLEQHIQTDYQTLTSIGSLQQDVSKQYSALLGNLMNTKDGVIKIAEIFTKYSAINHRLKKQFDELLEIFQMVLKEKNEFKSILANNGRSIPDIDRFKDDMKDIRDQYMVVRERLKTNIDQTMIFKYSATKNEDREKLSMSLDNVKRDVRDLSDSFDIVEKYVRRLDVMLTKTKMTMDESEQQASVVNSNDIDIETFREQSAKSEVMIRNLESDNDLYEGQLVNDLKMLHDGYKKLYSRNMEIKDLAIIPNTNELVDAQSSDFVM